MYPYHILHIVHFQQFFINVVQWQKTGIISIYSMYMYLYICYLYYISSGFVNCWPFLLQPSLILKKRYGGMQNCCFIFQLCSRLQRWKMEKGRRIFILMVVCSVITLCMRLMVRLSVSFCFSFCQFGHTVLMSWKGILQYCPAIKIYRYIYVYIYVHAHVCLLLNLI